MGRLVEVEDVVDPMDEFEGVLFTGVVLPELEVELVFCSFGC